MEDEIPIEKPSKKKEKNSLQHSLQQEIPKTEEVHSLKEKKKQTREYVMTPARAAAVERMKEARLKKAAEANETKAKKAEHIQKLLEEDNAKKDKDNAKKLEVESEEEEIVKPKQKKKPRKQVIVFESESESEEENQIIIRRKRKQPKDIAQVLPAQVLPEPPQVLPILRLRRLR
jgi:hypothetical protein